MSNTSLFSPLNMNRSRFRMQDLTRRSSRKFFRTQSVNLKVQEEAESTLTISEKSPLSLIDANKEAQHYDLFNKLLMAQLRAEDDNLSVNYSCLDLPEYLIQNTFQSLATMWRNETKYSSSPTEKNNHWAYQQIIGIGWPVVPVLLRELEVNPDHWFYALRKITGANPVPPESRGKLNEMASAWLHWAKNNGISW